VAVLSRLLFFGIPRAPGAGGAVGWAGLGRAMRPSRRYGPRWRHLGRPPRPPGARVRAGDEVDRMAETRKRHASTDWRLGRNAARFGADAPEELGPRWPPPGYQLRGRGWPQPRRGLAGHGANAPPAPAVERLVRDRYTWPGRRPAPPGRPWLPVDLDDHSAVGCVTRCGGRARSVEKFRRCLPLTIVGRQKDLRRAVSQHVEHDETPIARSKVRVGLWTGEDGDITLVVGGRRRRGEPHELDLVFGGSTRCRRPAVVKYRGDRLGARRWTSLRDLALDKRGVASASKQAGPGSVSCSTCPPTPHQPPPSPIPANGNGSHRRQGPSGSPTDAGAGA